MPDSSRVHDALLLLSFGGPEKPDDVVPFLENVTRGKQIPRERLVEVGEHYFRFGGKSPINDQCRDFLKAVRADFDAHGLDDVPVYWGNRNWEPYLDDTVRQMVADGVHRVAVLVTSAYASYSGCRQYRENLYDAVERLGDGDIEVGSRQISFSKLRHYCSHPGFVEANVDAVVAAWRKLPADRRDRARLVFVTHSIPDTMNDTSGPDGGAYVTQHADVAAAVADQVARRTGAALAHDVVYCSRSGPPHVPWLEPDVNDHLEALASDGVEAVVLSPIGFVSDHMEVAFDLDVEAAATARDLGMAVQRAATAGVHPAFVSVVRDLFVEREAAEKGQTPERAATGGLSACWDLCQAHCCPNPRAERAALCEESS